MSVQTTTSLASATPEVALATKSVAKTFPVKASDDPKETPKNHSTTREEIEVAAKKTQDFVRPLNSSLQFKVDDSTGVVVVKVIDNQTSQTIRQIPSEEMLVIARALDQLSGLLIKSSA